jgi:molecular chaperone GrpE
MFDPFNAPGPRAGSGEPTDGASGPATEPKVGSETEPAPAEGAAPTDAGAPNQATAEEPTPTDEAGSAHHNLSALSAKADEYLGLAQRTKADFENYRKRAMREAAAAQERGAVKLAKALLPAIDNLDRALAHGVSTADTDNGTASFVAGIEHVRSDVIEALGHVGIESYWPEGQPFDPQFHEAVAQQAVAGVKSGTVVEVYQRGYRLGDHVLRPARVVVAA